VHSDTNVFNILSSQTVHPGSDNVMASIGNSASISGTRHRS